MGDSKASTKKMKSKASSKNEDDSNEPDGTDSGDEEVTVEDIMRTIAKGVSKAFTTSTSNRDRVAPKRDDAEPVKAAKVCKTGPISFRDPYVAYNTTQKTNRVSIRVLPNETTEINERKYRQIASNGVIKLFELLNP
ncbi:hypothetical protein BgAZ_501530 [Babesia gibsoni]|uniref:Uncharacterized protein n=1 Tax=Babesia gibsoni TaxID=33632 RepID=A0AAD8LN68_BABGI|nr:hypothetical protein BgAZ_501530 [Babesia gibsoni]